MSKRILVAGGAGFLGSHLVRSLVDLGHHVVVVDNFHTGRKENVLQSNLVDLVYHDITVANFPSRIGRVDEVYNLACPASPPAYQRGPLYTLEVNYVGTRNLLEYATRCGAKFFQASTSEIYGDPLVHPQTEDYRGNTNTVGPRSCYDEGKRVAETLCYEYHQMGLNVKIARIFNTYGEYMSADDGRVVSNFIMQALRGQDITVYGGGQQTRSFCYASDLINGFLHLMDHTPTRFMGPVNIGRPVEFTILELAEQVLSLIPDTGSKLVYNALPVDDPQQRKPDISLINRITDWEPTVDLQQGLKRTIEYFKTQL